MNIQTARKIIGSQLPPRKIAHEWIGVEVRSSWRGVGVVSEAFHNVNDGISIKVIYPNGSGWTFTDKVSVVAWPSNA
jgi:hypothetical protein